MKHLIAGLSAAAILGLAGAASAAEVNVSIGAELQRHSRAYGERDLADLKKELAEDVQKALAKKGAAPVQRVDLVIQSATPNRPTFPVLGATPGLSMFSAGIGGATITGTVTGADGVARPVSYDWHETDIHRVVGYSTWTDANFAFDRLAREIGHGRTPNEARYHPDLASAAAFDSLNRLRNN